MSARFATPTSIRDGWAALQLRVTTQAPAAP